MADVKVDGKKIPVPGGYSRYFRSLLRIYADVEGIELSSRAAKFLTDRAIRHTLERTDSHRERFSLLAEAIHNLPTTIELVMRKSKNKNITLKQLKTALRDYSKECVFPWCSGD